MYEVSTSLSTHTGEDFAAEREGESPAQDHKARKQGTRSDLMLSHLSWILCLYVQASLAFYNHPGISNQFLRLCGIISRSGILISLILGGNWKFVHYKLAERGSATGTPTSTISGPQKKINACVDKNDHFFQLFSFSSSACFPVLGNVKICLWAA